MISLKDAFKVCQGVMMERLASRLLQKQHISYMTFPSLNSSFSLLGFVFFSNCKRIEMKRSRSRIVNTTYQQACTTICIGFSCRLRLVKRILLISMFGTLDTALNGI